MRGAKGREPTMRNLYLAIAIAFVLAAPCTTILGCSPSLADEKPKESVTFGFGTVKQDYKPQKPDGSGRVGSPTTKGKGTTTTPTATGVQQK